MPFSWGIPPSTPKSTRCIDRAMQCPTPTISSANLPAAGGLKFLILLNCVYEMLFITRMEKICSDQRYWWNGLRRLLVVGRIVTMTANVIVHEIVIEIGIVNTVIETGDVPEVGLPREDEIAGKDIVTAEKEMEGDRGLVQGHFRTLGIIENLN